MSTPCLVCPRRCATDRDSHAGTRRSLCRAPSAVRLALVSLHQWEEPCISGMNGAGTVFFSHCNLRCCFCQNYEISALGRGEEVSIGRLAEIFLEQQARGASCLELVTATHYTEQAVLALSAARRSGLSIPVAWNSNGYELPESLRLLEGLVDIFMPDLKYRDSRYGELYSGVPGYFETASAAIRTMFDIAGPARFDRNGMMRSGLLVRHLVLPGLWRDSCRCVDWLWENFGDDIWFSLMNQYMPLYRACRHPEINRPLTTMEYQKVVRHARSLGMKNAFIQCGRTDKAMFIPRFDGSNVLHGC